MACHGYSINQFISAFHTGLFSGAIMQSGSSLDPCHRGSSFRQVAELVGHELGCQDLDSSAALLACLRNIPAERLASTIFEFFVRLKSTIVHLLFF